MEGRRAIDLASAPSYAEWTKVIEGGANNNSGDTGYVDYEGILKHDGFVYWCSP